MSDTSNNRIYFAAKEVEELACDITDKVDDYRQYLLASGKAELWDKCYNMYNRGSIMNGNLGSAGEHEEFVMMDVNHYKSLLTNIHNMTTNQKPVMEPHAINTDTESLAQAKLAKGLLDYYMRQKKVSRYLKQAVKSGLNYGEGFIVVEWDAQSGEEYGVNPETGAAVTEGDLKFSFLQPHFVTRDVTKMDYEKNDWMITTTYENKFDLAARYPEIKEQILDVDGSEDEFFLKMKLDKTAFNDTDDIPVYTLYHKRTNVMPQGRKTIVVGADVVLFDGPIPYRNLPIYRLAPSQQDFSAFGDTIGFDLLAIQEAINSLYSTVATNQSTFGVQNLLIPRGFNISVNSLTGGLNLIEYDPNVGKPEPLQLTLTAPEIFNFIQQLERLMETLSGVNSVSRGNPESNLKSGNALALVQSMAIQFNSGLAQSYVEVIEDVGTAIITILQDFASVPRVAMIAGKYNKSYMKEFSGKDLSQIQRVLVDVGNPLASTLAGKMQIADNLMQAGFINDADQYLVVLETGNLDPVLEGPLKEQYQIRQENELMATGEEVVALITDNHKQHINEHKAVLSSPESRKNPEVIRATLAHIMEHIGQLKTADPVLLQILGQEPVQAQPGTQPNQPAQGKIPPQPKASGEVPVVQPNSPVTEMAAKTKMPNPPAGTDPASAEVINNMGK